MNGRSMRAGLSVIAVLLLSSAAFAQDSNEDGIDFLVHGPESVADEVGADPALDGDDTSGDFEGIAVGELDPKDELWPVIIIDPFLENDDVGVLPDDVGSGEDGSDDDSSDDDWVWDEGDGIIVIDDGLCVGVECVPGDGSYTYDGGYTDDGDIVWYFLEGPRPEDCPECRDLPVEIYQMNAGGPLVTDSKTAPSKSSRRSRVASFTPSTAAECLALYPQLPWLCEWQNTSGQ
jgi:hypothetical protein